MIKAKIAALTAGSALVLNLLAPVAFADTTIDVSGNGADSKNTVEVTNTDKTTVTQSNSTVIGINIDSSAKTGGNKANGNTGDGDVTIDTGKATSTVTVEVKGSTNSIVMPDCGCTPPATDVTVSGNGKNSTNKTTVKNKKKKDVAQGNASVVGANITSKTKTGKNKANNNTGPGLVEIKTDDATSDVTTTVDAPSNSITP